MVFLSFLIIISRLFFFKSPGFLIAKGKFDEARQVVKAMLGPDVEIPPSYLEKTSSSNGAKVDLFKGETLQKVIFPVCLGDVQGSEYMESASFSRY